MVATGQQARFEIGLNEASFWAPNFLSNSAWLEHAPFAFWLMTTARPSSVVELGTHTGLSYFAFCQAVAALDLPTKCYAVDTWQGDEHAGRYGERIFSIVQSHNAQHYAGFSKLLRRTFSEALADVPDGTVDLLHVDGRHFYDDVREDFTSWERKLSPRAIVLFHDTNVYDRDFGVHRYWAELKAQHPSFEFMHGCGLGVLGYGAEISEDMRKFFATFADPVAAAAIREAYARLGSAVHFAAKIDGIREGLAQRPAHRIEDWQRALVGKPPRRVKVGDWVV